MESNMSQYKQYGMTALIAAIVALVVAGIVCMACYRSPRMEMHKMMRMGEMKCMEGGKCAMMDGVSGMNHKMGGNMSMHSMMMDMSASLKGKTGDEFDKAFLAEMIVHHEGAVEMANMVLQSSNRAELKKLANDIITAQQAEIKMMQDWQKAWFPTTK